MSYAHTEPLTVSPYQLEPLIASIAKDSPRRSTSRSAVSVQVCCAQALGSEIYVGCSNGELQRFALQANDPNKPASYVVLSRQVLPTEKRIEELVLVPSISRVLILSDHQIYFYTLPSLDRVPPEIIKPIKGVDAFTVDHQHLRKPPADLSASPKSVDPVPFCVVKGATITLYTLREKLQYIKEITLPSQVRLARQTGQFLCVADKEHYNVVDLKSSSMVPLLPVSKDVPRIAVVGDDEFLLLSWNGASTVGLFVTGAGDPVRGTLEWPVYPESICIDFPFLTTLLPDGTIEIQNIEDQQIVQIIPPSPSSTPKSRLSLSSCLNGYFVPSTPRSDNTRMTPFSLSRTSSAKAPVSAETIQDVDRI